MMTIDITSLETVTGGNVGAPTYRTWGGKTAGDRARAHANGKLEFQLGADAKAGQKIILDLVKPYMKP